MSKVTKQAKTKQLRGRIKDELLQLYNTHESKFASFIKDTRVKEIMKEKGKSEKNMEDFIKNNKAELDGMKNKSGKNLKKKIENNDGILGSDEENEFIMENSNESDLKEHEDEIQRREDSLTQQNLSNLGVITSEETEVEVNETFERKELSELQKIRASKISEKNLVKNEQLEYIREQSKGLKASRDNQSIVTLFLIDQMKEKLNEKKHEKSIQNKNQELEIVQAISKYKELHDQGALTLEEFQEKKKKLLSL
jgi:hypothetical protein